MATSRDLAKASHRDLCRSLYWCSEKTALVWRELPTGHRSRPIQRGMRHPRCWGAQGAIGRSRRIGSVPEGYANSGRRPRVTLRSAALRFARDPRRPSQRPHEKVQGALSGVPFLLISSSDGGFGFGSALRDHSNRYHHSSLLRQSRLRGLEGLHLCRIPPITSRFTRPFSIGSLYIYKLHGSRGRPLEQPAMISTTPIERRWTSARDLCPTGPGIQETGGRSRRFCVWGKIKHEFTTEKTALGSAWLLLCTPPCCFFSDADYREHLKVIFISGGRRSRLRSRSRSCSRVRRPSGG